MTDFEFTLNDRITKIKSMERYNLNENAFISFSGGKDSCVVSKLIDLALPGNTIPRMFINTGIEYNEIVKFVKQLAEKDKRIVIVTAGVNIKQMLEKVGYPFKSKEHSLYLSVYQNGGMERKTVRKYLTRTDTYSCPQKLRYQFSENFNIKVSNNCCFELKKKVSENWKQNNGKSITITGMRRAEGGLRKSHTGCTVFYDDDCKELKKFHPIFPCGEDFVEEFIKQYKIELCSLYAPPLNFKRTGCKGCPFSRDLQKQLDIMSMYMPKELKQCEMIWGPVYDEYRRIGYRLCPDKYLI